MLGKPYVEVFRYRDDGIEDKRYIVGDPSPSGREPSKVIDEVGHDVVVTNRLVCERLVLDHTEALRVLKPPVAARDLIQEGERRGTSYRLARASDADQTSTP